MAIIASPRQRAWRSTAWAGFCQPCMRMGVDRPAIVRLLDPKHASKPGQFDAAFAALGKRLVLSLENAA